MSPTNRPPPSVDYEPRADARNVRRGNVLTCARAAMILWLVCWVPLAIAAFAGVDFREGTRARSVPIAVVERVRDGTVYTVLAIPAAVGLVLLRPRQGQRRDP